MSIRKKHGLSFIEDITADVQKVESHIEELMYEVKTVNPKVNVVIFSSICCSTRKTRPSGTDAVRLVLKLKSGSENFYYKYKTLKRTTNFFDRFEKALVKACKEDCNRKNYNWKPYEDLFRKS